MGTSRAFIIQFRFTETVGWTETPCGLWLIVSQEGVRDGAAA